VLKFLNNNTQAFEAETGLTINEPGTLAVKATIEAAVVELIKEGERKGVWDYRTPMVQIPSDARPVAPAALPVIKNDPVPTPVVPSTPEVAEQIGYEAAPAGQR
jgi:hypothetical protein